MREVRKCAKFQTARSSKLREVPYGANVVWDLALFGTSRCLGPSAVWNLALFGTSRCLGLRALWAAREGRGRRPDPPSNPNYAAFTSGVVGSVVETGIVASIGTTLPFPIRLADFHAAKVFGSSTSALFTCASSNRRTTCARDAVTLSPSRA